MKKILFGAIAAAGALSLAACETATPYQPLNAPGSQASGGFAEYRIEPNRWRVEFRGNSLTSRDRVERYLLFRAADLTLQQGFDWFTTVDRNTERKSSYYTTPDPFYSSWGGGYWGPSWGLYHRRYGWGYGFGGFGPYGGFGYGPWGSSFDVNEVSQYTASSEIVMGRGPKPAGDPRAFDARAVIDHLRGSIELPGAPR